MRHVRLAVCPRFLRRVGLALAAALVITPLIDLRSAGAAFVEILPRSSVGGKVITGQVTLEYPAGPGGIVVALSSSDPAAAVPQVSRVLVPEGALSATFKIRTRRVAAPAAVAIRATANGITESRELTVTP